MCYELPKEKFETPSRISNLLFGRVKELSAENGLLGLLGLEPAPKKDDRLGEDALLLALLALFKEKGFGASS